MIMVPAENFFQHQEPQEKNHYITDHGYVGCDDDNYPGTLGVISSRKSSSWYEDRDAGVGVGETCLGSDHYRMAEEESRSTTCSFNESGSSSKGTTTPTKDDENNKDIDDTWLQLGLGGSEIKQDPPQIGTLTTTRTGHDLIELDLFSGANRQHMKPLTTSSPNTSHNTSSIISTPRPSNSLFLQHPRTNYSFLNHQQDVSWGTNYRPNPWNPTISSSLLLNPPSTMSMYYPQRFQNPVCSGNSDFRVIDPPRRPHSGVWVLLQASQNQEQEPMLPQIPKNYLRIKDGRTTVRLLTKYLVNKLRLNNEDEIEIWCRGEELVSSLTLQHVRDNIWISSSNSHPSRSSCRRVSSEPDLYPHFSSVVTLLPNSSPTDHVMILHYASRGKPINPSSVLDHVISY